MAIPAGIGGDDKEDPRDVAKDKLMDLAPDAINILAMNKEIEEGTQREAEKRDKAIKENCKKP